jgi:hypothetical protein
MDFFKIDTIYRVDFHAVITDERHAAHGLWQLCFSI